MLRTRQRADDFQEFLQVIHDHYRGWHVALLMDEDRSHTAKGTKELLEHFDIQCLWLPYRSPQLNPMESLWGEGKEVICANQQYESIQCQADRFIEYLYDLPNQAALSTGGLNSDDFWLRNVMCKNLRGPA